MSEVKKMQQKRLKVNFLDDDEDESSTALQKQINSHTQDITDVTTMLYNYNSLQLVRACDSKLKELMKFKSEDKHDD